MSTKLPLLREVFMRYPGASTVVLVFAVDPNWEAKMAPLPNVKVTPNEHFIADIEEVLGKGTITLVS